MASNGPRGPYSVIARNPLAISQSPCSLPIGKAKAHTEMPTDAGEDRIWVGELWAQPLVVVESLSHIRIAAMLLPVHDSSLTQQRAFFDLQEVVGGRLMCLREGVPVHRLPLERAKDHQERAGLSIRPEVLPPIRDTPQHAGL